MNLLATLILVAATQMPWEKPAAESAKPAPAVEAAKPAPKAKATKPAPKAKAKVAKAEVKEKAAAPMPRAVKITSERTDYDRKEGVILFDRNVFVDDPEYKMHADQLYVFLDGTNDLKRIVAMGNVAITNETRVGLCAKAAYTKATSKIVMYGDGKDKKAHLIDNGKKKSEVEGRKITFWIDSEQVEVEGSTVTLDAGAMGGKDGAKKLLGK